MFEKEAEKYASDLELIYKKGVLDGYSKANEWHYVKDGDLPNTENLECLCIIRPMKEEGQRKLIS